ncbi:ABC transporter ATP-binding protein [Arthrobacter sp. BF1]|uniref:ATP-binding cassette domain-containing protein n=1 Tax=Arthrobacter sp. BF1 TaxID=2821145 RepID=UPI001C4E90E3|nr:ABC transporter ATP-binding protein [Arthrobacter sp. BF1]
MPESLIIDNLHASGTTSASAPLPVLTGVSLSVQPGEFVALIGGSGSGKTITAMSAMQLLPPQLAVTSGSIRLGKLELTLATENQLNQMRGGRMGMLFQQPKRMFNPRMTIGAHLREPLRLHGKLRGHAAEAQVISLLAEVGLPDPAWCAKAYPHQLSGGMAQRAMTAVALAGQPDILIADEPTSALDKSLEGQILSLIDSQRRDRGLGVLYITHNIATVAAFADRILVMKNGRIIESGPTAQVLSNPQSDETKHLLNASSLSASSTGHTSTNAPKVLTVDGASKAFRMRRGRKKAVLSNVSLSLHRGEILGILGQSGSGKSTLARSIVGLEELDSGHITHTSGGNGSESAAVGPKVQLVFQEPHDSFDPRMKLRTSLEAPLLRHTKITAADRRERVERVTNEVGLDSRLLDHRPGQCSGGQLQRMAIARALLLEPDVLICDEATSALDALTQRRILDLLLRLHKERGLSLMIISHDMAIIQHMCNRVAVIFEGQLVELAATDEFFKTPRHAHSQELVAVSAPLWPLPNIESGQLPAPNVL